MISMRLIILKIRSRYCNSQERFTLIAFVDLERKANWKAFRIEVHSFTKACRFLSIVCKRLLTYICILYIVYIVYIFNSFLLRISC